MSDSLRKVLSMLLTVVLLFTQTGITVLANDNMDSTPPLITSGVITAFEPLADDVMEQTVPKGTQRDELNLPDVLDSFIGYMDYTDVTSPAALSVVRQVPVIEWKSEPDYNPDSEGEYAFTPVLDTAWQLDLGVKLPVITVTVEDVPLSQVTGGVITAFEPLDADVAAQTVPFGTSLDDLKLLDILTAIIESDPDTPVSIPVTTWTSVPDYQGFVGDYVFTPEFATDWTLNPGADTPTITVTVQGLQIIPLAAVSNVNYLDENGATKTIGSATVIETATTTLNTGWYVVNSNITTTNLTVNGDVNIILANNCTLTANGNNGNAGIHVGDGKTLTIYGQSTVEGTMGKLNATGADEAAGIGGKTCMISDWDYNPILANSGNIYIYGGNITAQGGKWGAGIGSGQWGENGSIILAGSCKINATGGNMAAGIGGGSGSISSSATDGSGGNILIKGNANVTAKGGIQGAGIGGGYGGNGGDITIEGTAIVKADGGDSAAGIGGGYRDTFSPYLGGSGGTITINGGTVTATGGGTMPGGAGIGGGPKGSSGNITINGGIISATGGTDGGAGIGSGMGFSTGSPGEAGTVDSIIINDGDITAKGGNNSAGIGGGQWVGGGTIEIHGGTVTATGNAGSVGGAGIGGGCYSPGADVTITGGVVTATGGTSGAGIGGGGGSVSSQAGAGGNVEISGGTVIANGAGNGAGIGGGGGAKPATDPGTAEVTGGSVTTSGGQPGNSAPIQNGGGETTYAVEVTVTNGSNPVEGAEVVCESYKAVTNSSGKATIRLATGEKSITAKPPASLSGYYERNGNITVTSGTNTITIALGTTPPVAPTITTVSLPGGAFGVAYSQTLTATGDTPITWSVTAGSLPSGLSLNASTGEISGTPTAAGTATFTVKADNGVNPHATAELSISIAKVNQTTPTISGGNISKVYGESATLSVSGGESTGAYSYESSETNVATVNASGIVTITGVGSTTLSVKKLGDSNYNDSASASVTLTVSKASQNAPNAPTAASKTATSITLSVINGAEYSQSASGPWQTSPTFGSLTPNTSYTFYARLAANTTHEASPASVASATITTDNATLGGTVSIDGTAAFGQTLTVVTTSLAPTPTVTLGTLSYQWKRNGTTDIGTNSNQYTIVEADIGQTITVTVTAANCGGSVTSPATNPVGKATQTTPTINDGDISKVYGETFTLSVTGGESTGAYSYESSNTSIATVNTSGNVAITGVGSTTLSVKKLGDSKYNDSATSSVTLTVGKASQTTPDAPTMASTATTSITLNEISGAQYSKDGTNWQASTTFGGLTPNTGYTFYAKLVATSTHNESPASVASTTITTEKATLGGSVSIDGTATFGQTLTAIATSLESTPEVELGTLTYQWKRGGTTDIGTDETYTINSADDIGQTITVTVTAANCSGSVTSSATGTVSKATQNAPIAPIEASKTANSITLNTISGAEYSKDGTNWQSSPTFIGLTPNTGYNFYARLAQTSTHNASPASGSSATITTSKAALDGSVTIDGTGKFGQTLTANIGSLTTNPAGAEKGTLSYEWKRGTTPIGTDSNQYTIAEADIGQTITVTVTAANCTGAVTSSATAMIARADGPVAPTVTGSYTGNGTTFTYTVSPVTGAEYRMDSGAWQDSNVFTGITPLANHTFSAHIKETTTHNSGAIGNTGAVTFALLDDRSAPALAHSVTTEANGDKTITITPVTGAEYKFGNDAWGSGTTKTYSPTGSITIQIRYAANATHNASPAASADINLSKSSQSAPASINLTSNYNAANNTFTVTIGEVSGCEYSFDGSNFSSTRTATAQPGDTVIGYIRKAETSEYNASSAISDSVTLPVPVTGVTVSGENGATAISVDSGTLQMVANVLPANATDKTVTWSVTSGNSYASISSTGVLTATANGTVTVRATANDGYGKYGETNITISGQSVPVTSITVSGAGDATAIIAKGDTLQMQANILPLDATVKTVTWTITSGGGYASISNTGLLTATANGTVTVRATANDGSGKYGEASITIIGQTTLATSVAVSSAGGATAITAKGGTLQMQANILPLDATDKTVTWTVTSGGSYASISNTGLLTATANGTVTVRATANDGSGKYGEASITISGQNSGNSGSGDNGGGSGGSSGGSSSDNTSNNSSTAETTTPTTETGVATITGNVNGQSVDLTQNNATGTVSVAVSAVEAEKAIETAKDTGQVVISIPKADTITAETPVEATVSKEAFTAINDSGATLTLDTPAVTISFDTDAVGTIAGAGNGDVKISAGLADTSNLNESQREVVGDRPVYDFTVTVGNKTVSEFGGNVSVSLPYTLQPGENPNAIVVYYIDANGDVKTLPGGVYDPSTGKVLFITDHFSLYMIGYNDKTFTDVSKSHWALSNVTFVAARGLMNGISDVDFAPNASMTRAMFAQVLANLDGVDLSSYKTSRFGDVPVSAWYASAVEWAVDKGIVGGVGEGLFDPDANVTREQMAVMMVKYMRYKGYALPSKTSAAFADEKRISEWAVDAVKAIQDTGIVTGKPGNLFDPQGTATRAEVATIFARFIGLAAGGNTGQDANNTKTGGQFNALLDDRRKHPIVGNDEKKDT